MTGNRPSKTGAEQSAPVDWLHAAESLAKEIRIDERLQQLNRIMEDSRIYPVFHEIDMLSRKIKHFTGGEHRQKRRFLGLLISKGGSLPTESLGVIKRRRVKISRLIEEAIAGLDAEPGIDATELKKWIETGVRISEKLKEGTPLWIFDPITVFANALRPKATNNKTFRQTYLERVLIVELKPYTYPSPPRYDLVAIAVEVALNVSDVIDPDDVSNRWRSFLAK